MLALLLKKVNIVQDLKSRTIKDIMMMEIIAVKNTDSVPYVLEVFNEYHVSSVPVLNEDGDVVLGFIAERVLLRALGDSLRVEKGDDLTPEKVEMPSITDVMRHTTDIVYEDDNVFSVLELFTGHGFKTALVMDDEERLTGVVTRRELFKSMEEYLHHKYQHKHSHRIPVKISEKYRERAELSLSALI